MHLHRQKTRTVKLNSVIICFACLFLFGHLTMAQSRINTDLNLYDHDSKPYYFGITLGVNSPRFQTEMHSRFIQNDSVYTAEPNNSYGFGLGLLATGIGTHCIL